MWQSLVKIALLGTENSQLDQGLTEQLSMLGVDTGEEAPLVVANGAAMVGQLKKAGFLLRNFDGKLPSTTLVSTGKLPSARSAHHLHLILTGLHKAVFPEYLEKLGLSGKSLPPVAIPSLMSFADLGQYWHQVEPLLGEKGRWLLEQHPEWAKRLANPTSVEWQTGTRQERLALLKYWRERTPAVGLDLLRSTWETESWTDKSAFLGTLKSGLSMADEAFLEQCLDEKRQEIRGIAAQLLAKLPNSKLVERLGQMATNILELKGPALLIRPLADWPASAIRDGIPKSKGDQDELASIGYLVQLLTKLPPSFWEDFSGKQPLEFLEILHQSEWHSQLIQGIAKSLDLHTAPNWATALLAFWYEHGELIGWQEEDGGAVFQQIPSEEVSQWAIRCLKDAPTLPTEESLLLRLLKNNKHAWSDELSTLVVRKFRQEIVRDYRQFWQLQHLKQYLELVSLRCSPKLYDQLNTGWSNDSVQWRMWEKPVEDMLNRVLFRREMANELAI